MWISLNSCLELKYYAVDYRGEANVPAQLPPGEVPLGCNGHEEGLDRRARDLERGVHQLGGVLYQWPLKKQNTSTEVAVATS